MGKILLCDDEESLCRSLGRILRAAGHEVTTVDGIAGHLLLQQREQRFDLILTDIRMAVPSAPTAQTSVGPVPRTAKSSRARPSTDAEDR